jgi:hypothetical protein
MRGLRFKLFFFWIPGNPLEILVAGEGCKPAGFCLIATIHEHKCH